MAADPCLFPRNEDDQVQELRRIANLNPHESPLETMHRNLERAMRDAGLRVWEVPHLPVPNPLAMPLAEERVRFRRLQAGACRGLMALLLVSIVGGLYSVFGVEDLFLSILFWVLATSCVPLWLMCGPHQPEVR